MSFAKSLIFSRNADNTQLSLERIQQLAPAVFSASKAERLTERYISLHTSDLIPVMQDYGYVPMQAAQRGSRKPKGIILDSFGNNSEIVSDSQFVNPLRIDSHNAHLISFAKADSLEGDLRPEIILYNSHDGSSSVQLYAGCYRFICSNGIVAGEGFNSRMYHSKLGLSGFEEMLRNTVESLPMMMDRINALKQVQLNQEQVKEMARLGVSTRWNVLEDIMPWGERKGTYATNMTINAATHVQRMGDSGTDAFSVFNRIQEAVMRGKAYVTSYTDKNPDGQVRKARPVAAVKESIRINSELWDVAESVAFG